MDHYLRALAIPGYCMLAYTSCWFFYYIASGRDICLAMYCLFFCFPVVLLYALLGALPALFTGRLLSLKPDLHTVIVSAIMCAQMIAWFTLPTTGNAC